MGRKKTKKRELLVVRVDHIGTREEHEKIRRQALRYLLQAGREKPKGRETTM